MSDDSTLIDHALGGDVSAFGVLVEKYQNRLFHSLVHVTGSPEEAEDVAQDAFVQAFKKLKTFQRRSSFYTWTYRIAYNLWISHLRRRRPDLSLDQHQQQSRNLDDHSETPLDCVLRREQVQQVQQAISMLGEEHRAILVLREIDGCDYETIAEILRVPVGTVRSRLHRARLQLRHYLEDILRGQST